MLDPKPETAADGRHEAEAQVATLPVPAAGRALAANRNQPLIAREQRDLLCALAYVALGVGDAAQAVTLLGLVLREAPDDAGVLRLTAYALVAAGNGAQALAALDRLERVETEAPAAPLLLLRSQALRLAGRLDEGRTVFRRFVEARKTEETTA
jgi:predicted Zn-dependent protease